VARDAAGIGLVPLGVAASPLLGPQGNREFFLHLGVGREAVSGDGELRDRIAQVTGG
jgi:hypothetical protein